MKVIKDRIEEIMTLIAEVANGNFDYEIDASETGDELDAIIAGVSMLGQELKNSTVSRDFMQSIYQGVVDMLLILNTDLTIRTVNEAFLELLGYQEEDLIGLPFIQFIQLQDQPKFIGHINSCKEKGKCLNEELFLLSSQQREVPASCSFSFLLNSKNEVDGILIIAKDITEVKRTEYALREAKIKAEAANEAKSNFLSSMSHEIRTPLNGILGFTNILMNDKLTTTQARYVQLIKTSGSTLSKLLNDIMDLHRIEQDKISLETIAFNIRESFASNLDPYRQIAKDKGLGFNYSFADDVPTTVLGDPTRIGQVLINLVSNAIKFTEQGNVQVKLSAEKITGDRSSFVLKCTVLDTGIGIPVQKQEEIFKSFTQSDQSITRKYGGFGLGLAISQKLVNLMDGEMGIISPPEPAEKGSCFWFTLQLNSVGQPDEQEQVDNSNKDFYLLNLPQVLVVDDNEINILLLKTVLENMKAIVSSASSGKDAIELVRHKKFDIVFMDIQMPYMDGLEAATQLRSLHFKGPIIAFSANAYKNDIQKSLEAGMNDHICKPLDMEQLISVLKKWLK